MALQLVINNPARATTPVAKHLAPPATNANWALSALMIEGSSMPTVRSVMRDFLAYKIDGRRISEWVDSACEYGGPDYACARKVLRLYKLNVGIPDGGPVQVYMFHLTKPREFFQGCFPELAWAADIFLRHCGCYENGTPCVAEPSDNPAYYLPGKAMAAKPDLKRYREIAESVLTKKVGEATVLKALKCLSVPSYSPYSPFAAPVDEEYSRELLKQCGLKYKNGDRFLPLGIEITSERRFRAAFPDLPEHAVILIKQHVRIQPHGEPALRVPLESV